MQTSISSSFENIINLSSQEAMRTGHTEIRADHLMLGLLRLADTAVLEILGKIGTEARELKARIDDELFIEQAPTMAEAAPLRFGPEIRQVLGTAMEFARELGLKDCPADCMLMGLYQSDGVIGRFLREKTKGAELAEMVRSRHLVHENDLRTSIFIIKKSAVGSHSPGKLPS